MARQVNVTLCCLLLLCPKTLENVAFPSDTLRGKLTIWNHKGFQIIPPNFLPPFRITWRDELPLVLNFPMNQKQC